MKLGVMQGRLSPPIDGAIQEFPIEQWGNELYLAYKLGLVIEWIVTSNKYKSNPLFTRNLHGQPIHSVCVDALITPNIATAMDILVEKCAKYTKKQGISHLTLPFLEYASLTDSRNVDAYFTYMPTIFKKYPNLIFSLETDLEIGVLEKFMDFPNVGFTYDTGNVMGYGFDHTQFVEHPKLTNVHLKAKNSDGRSVPPWEVNFQWKGLFDRLDNLS